MKYKTFAKIARVPRIWSIGVTRTAPAEKAICALCRMAVEACSAGMEGVVGVGETGVGTFHTEACSWRETPGWATRSWWRKADEICWAMPTLLGVSRSVQGLLGLCVLAK